MQNRQIFLLILLGVIAGMGFLGDQALPDAHGLGRLAVHLESQAGEIGEGATAYAYLYRKGG